MNQSAPSPTAGGGAAKKIRIRRGLNLPIDGKPDAGKSVDLKNVKTVALLGSDYMELKPSMVAQVGDRVKKGQVLFNDKKSPKVNYTSPVSGVIKEINRGDKRVFQSIVIEVSGSDAEKFPKHESGRLSSLKREEVLSILLKSGAFTAFRARPYEKTADPDVLPKDIFVTAMDTNPLAPEAAPIIAMRREKFEAGLQVISTLTEGSVFVCTSPGTPVNVSGKIRVAEFRGPHPAGLPGTHIHFLSPVHEHRTVWHLGYQDVIAIGHLFTEGELYDEKIISLGGPQVAEPCIVVTRPGASLSEIVSGRLKPGENRVISGSVLSGRTASGPEGYLGRYHNQISVILEGRERVFLGWQTPGFGKFSVKNIYVSRMFPGKLFSFTTSTEGSPRAMVPIGMYEKIMPLDILPTQLLRYLIVRDTDMAVQLGALELAEEDLALCTFVCPGKTEYGPELRATLMLIEKGE